MPFSVNRSNSQYFQSQPSWFSDINEWWRGEGTCANSGWRPGTNIMEEEEENVDLEVEKKDKKHQSPRSWSYHEPKSSRDRARILMGGS